MTLSIDVGQLHLCAAFSQDKVHFDIYLFSTKKQKTFAEKIKTIYDQMESIPLHNVNKVIIEQQMPNSINIQIQYALGMYFMLKQIPFSSQNAGQKYKRFVGLDKKNMKNHSVEFIQGKLINIQIVLNQWEKKEYKNHLFLNDDARDFMKLNQIDKLDDIGDIVLMQLIDEKND